MEMIIILVKFMVDCGAEVIIISKKHTQNVELEEFYVTLHMWNKETSKTFGKIRMIVRNTENRKKYNMEFQVVKEKGTPLIGKNAAEAMKLITVKYDNFRLLHNVAAKNLVSEFNDVITTDDNALDTLPGTVRFYVDRKTEPKFVTPKRVPICLKDKLKEKLENMVNTGVIAEVDEPTEWVSQMTINMKKNKYTRVCLDPEALNRALKRDVYPMPVIDDVFFRSCQCIGIHKSGSPKWILTLCT